MTVNLESRIKRIRTDELRVQRQERSFRKWILMLNRLTTAVNIYGYEGRQPAEVL